MGVVDSAVVDVGVDVGACGGGWFVGVVGGVVGVVGACCCGVGCAGRQDVP